MLIFQFSMNVQNSLYTSQIWNLIVLIYLPSVETVSVAVPKVSSALTGCAVSFLCISVSSSAPWGWLITEERVNIGCLFTQQSQSTNKKGSGKVTKEGVNAGPSKSVWFLRTPRSDVELIRARFLLLLHSSLMGRVMRPVPQTCAALSSGSLPPLVTRTS